MKLKLSLSVTLIAALMLALPWAGAALSARDHYGLTAQGDIPELEPLAPERMRRQGVEASFVFFGFQGCTASCPAQIVNMRRLASRLERQDVRFLYISLDPDSVEETELDQWMRTLGPGFRAFRPADARAAGQLIQSFGGFSGHASASAANFEHSADLYLVTRAGRMLRYPGTALDLERVEQDLAALTDSPHDPAGVIAR